MNMMLEGKIYRGRRAGRKQDTSDPVVVEVGTFTKEKADFGTGYITKKDNWKNLKHQVFHSHTGFNWGYGGSGPADLARSILWDLLGEEPDLQLYQDFKFEFVTIWKAEEDWEIDEPTIRNWIVIRNFRIKTTGIGRFHK
jgi:hypothetical protein